MLRPGLAGAVAAMSGGGPAWALTVEQATAHVQATIGELVALLRQPGRAGRG